MWLPVSLNQIQNASDNGYDPVDKPETAKICEQGQRRRRENRRNLRNDTGRSISVASAGRRSVRSSRDSRLSTCTGAQSANPVVSACSARCAMTDSPLHSTALSGISTEYEPISGCATCSIISSQKSWRCKHTRKHEKCGVRPSE